MTTPLKKNVTATIDIAWLLYDIMNDTFLRGRTLQNDSNYKEVASLFASEDEENREKILRSIKKGFAEVKTELSEYLSEDGRATDNANITGEDNLILRLTMPGNFNEAATAGIAEAVHDYLKNRTIGEWYLLTNKNDADTYFTLAGSSMENIRKAVSRRARPRRPASSATI